MTQHTIRGRLVASLCLALTGAFLLAASDTAMGQDSKSTAVKPPAKVGKATTNQFVGPQKPTSPGVVTRRAPRNVGARPTGKKGAPALPKATVVLKPGEVPVMTIDTPSYNFGKVREGTEVVHDFWFTNTGNGPLEILRVKPS